MKYKNLIPVFVLFLRVFTFSQEIPEGGSPVLPENAIAKMTLLGGNRASRTLVDIEDMPFDGAVQVETREKAENRWDIQLNLGISTNVEKNDILLAVFWAKGIESCDETGEVYSELLFERSTDPWTKSVSHSITVIGEWRQFFIPFTCKEDYSAGQASIRFRLGYKPQTIQFGGLELLNYRKQIDIDDLPRTRIAYTGMEEDAPWRIQAEQMIDQYRKGELRIHVKDALGNPVRNAEIELRMTRHAYKFGSAVDARTMTRGDADAKRYNDIITSRFNRVVLENDLKWNPWETWNLTTTFAALDMMHDHHIEVRGHCLVWPGWNNLPGDLEANQNHPDYLRDRVLAHIEEEVDQCAGLVVDWDVINENYWNHDLMDILGNEVMIDWFHTAHQADPEANLYLNDNNIISGGGLDEKHRNHFIKTVEYLLDNEAPIRGLGTQCHFGSNPTPPERIWQILDELDDLDLMIQATEFDISSDDKAYQVSYTRDFMTAYFAHPSTVGILSWGFWAGKHWRPEAAFWDDQWNLTPHGEVWVELVTDTWRTEETLYSDSSGAASIRGFLGDYALEISYPGHTISTEIHHQTGETRITVSGNRVETDPDGSTASETDTESPDTYELGYARPNPFNPVTGIPYRLPETVRLRLSVYNSQGQKIVILEDGIKSAGHHTVQWPGLNSEGKPVPSGVYFIQLRTDTWNKTRKLILMR